jgi:hypothetical protein
MVRWRFGSQNHVGHDWHDRPIGWGRPAQPAHCSRKQNPTGGRPPDSIRPRQRSRRSQTGSRDAKSEAEDAKKEAEDAKSEAEDAKKEAEDAKQKAEEHEP